MKFRTGTGTESVTEYSFCDIYSVILTIVNSVIVVIFHVLQSNITITVAVWKHLFINYTLLLINFFNRKISNNDMMVN